MRLGLGTTGGAILLAAACATVSAAEYDCMIEARQHVEIRSPVEAMIESIKVVRGQYVKRGEVLATLVSGPERAALATAESRAKMVGDIKVSEARLDIAEKKFRRSEELFKRNFVSANARDEAEAEYRLASEELHRARENQRLAEFEAKRAAEVLELRTIRSPLSGVVAEVMLRPGEFGATTIKDPIMRLAELDPLHVEVVLPIAEFGKVKVGQRATVLPEAPIGGKYATRVKIVDRIVDAASGTFGVRLELSNPRHKIPAGVRCKVAFQ